MRPWKTQAHEVWLAAKRPFELVTLLRGKPEAWKRHVRTTAWQALLTLCIGAVIFWVSDPPEVADRSARTVRQRKERAEALRRQLRAPDAGPRAQQLVKALQVAAPFMNEVQKSLDAADAGVDVEAAFEQAVEAELDAPDAEETEGEDEDEADEEEASTWERPMWLARAWAWVALVLSSLVVAQWVTLALTRDFQIPVARTASELVGIEPEDDDRPPQVRVDWKWLRRKLGRRIRGVLIVIPGALLLAPTWVVLRLLRIDAFVMPVLLFAWTSFWWVSFTAARSARAWKYENEPTPAWPIRWWLERSQRGFPWNVFFPAWLARIAVRLTRREAAPAVAVERAPLTFVGLSLARLVTSLPLVRIFFRPLLDTAVAEALERSDTRARDGSPSA